MRIKLLVFVFALISLQLLAARPVSAQTIVGVQVEGNERLAPDAVLQYLTSRIGETVSKTKIRDDLRGLYNSGLFKDIRIDVEEAKGGVQIVVKVQEKEFIQEIRYKGNKAINKEDLDKAVAMKVPLLWDEALISGSIEKIQKVYREKGFNLVTIRTEIIPENQKKVLIFDVDEGDRVLVKKIYFQGNKVFSNAQLKEILISKEGGFWSFLSGSGRFDEQLLTQIDAKRLQFYYSRNGYAFAKVDPPSITFTPDRREVFISFTIEEGDRYDVGEINFYGDLEFIPDRDALKEDLSSQKGDTWNSLKIQEDIQKIQTIYGDHGYAYTNVSPEWHVNPDHPKVLDIDFRIDKGNLVYFGTIDIQGNLETFDRVIRRELEFHEGELFHQTKFKDSQKNLEKLGYFSTVKFIQKDVLAEQRMDVVIEVEEKQTGSLTLGASFSSYDRFGLQGAVSKVNLFGRGYDTSLSVQLSSKRQLFQLMFRNPRVYDTKVSMTLQAYNTEFSSVDDTSVKETGGSVSLGYPLDKKWSVSGTYGIQDIDINIKDTIGALYPNSFGLGSSLTFALTRDTLNTREMFLPSSGTLNQISTQISSKYLGSDLSFLKFSLLSKKYIEVFEPETPVLGGSTISFALRADYLRDIEGRSVPYNERFIPGGIYSIRGHLYRSLGPYIYAPFSITGKRADDGEIGVTDVRQLRLGGNKQVIFNTEYLFDIFKEAKIKGLFFFDAGNTFPEGRWDWDEIRYSAGFGFRWFSPMGPLRFEWGIPLDRREGESSMLFDFSIGSPF